MKDSSSVYPFRVFLVEGTLSFKHLLCGLLVHVLFLYCRRMIFNSGKWWCVFFQDGRIEAEVKLTGILSLGALLPGEFRKYGTMIAPGLYAPVHQHFFVARMDMSVDSKPGEALNQVICF